MVERARGEGEWDERWCGRVERRGLKLTDKAPLDAVGLDHDVSCGDGVVVSKLDWLNASCLEASRLTLLSSHCEKGLLV